ncbi:unnamed protein product [Echinostoma caproni]|uniref:Ion_trans_2 domain-containing protein n=1 Tax=Echinostoma caproni TaxID=27848 RepID=A0A183AJL2_9TREM|nr:unnamed protein product [Echinostoma caproni]
MLTNDLLPVISIIEAVPFRSLRTGYGHVTPHTALGKFLTMMYAVFGIPLFVCYLSNNGNYMADVFQTCYLRVCRPVFKCLRVRCRRLICCARLTPDQSRVKLKQTGFKWDASLNEWHDEQCTSETRRFQASPLESERIKLQCNYTQEISQTASVAKNYNLHLIRPKFLITSDTETWGDGVNEEEDPTGINGIHIPASREAPCLISSTCSPPSPFLNLKKQPDEQSNSSASTITDSMETLDEPFPVNPICFPVETTATTRNYTELDPRAHLPMQQWTAEPSIMSEYNTFDSKLTRTVDEYQQTESHLSEEKPSTVPLLLTIFIMTVYIMIGTTVFCVWESADYLKWSYFCFVTLSTIGFGDIVPGK